jgi:hypothetical protein
MEQRGFLLPIMYLVLEVMPFLGLIIKIIFGYLVGLVIVLQIHIMIFGSLMELIGHGFLDQI